MCYDDVVNQVAGAEVSMATGLKGIATIGWAQAVWLSRGGVPPGR